MKFLVIKGKHQWESTPVCEYEIHSVYNSSMDYDSNPDWFMEKFLNHRKGIDQWTVGNWYTYVKHLYKADVIDGERIPWTDIYVIEHMNRSWYGFIKESEMIKFLNNG